MNAIEAKGITFSYNKTEVIHNVSFILKEGEFLGIIGPNGAGKSTILRILCRILIIKTGTITVFNKDINSLAQKELAHLFGFVPQETHFGLDFSVEDIILMGRYPYLRPFQRETKNDCEAVERAIQYANIEEFRRRRINSLSSGERQRVVIARVLAQKPNILLLDEPTSHLDLKHQYDIMRLLKELNSQGMSVIIVNHDLNLASLYCQRLILMHHGKIYAEGTPQSLINEKTIKEVYNTAVKIVTHPDKNLPQIFLK